MRRRHFIALIGSFGFAPASAAAQTPPRIYRVGFLSPAVPIADNSGPGSAFLKGMAERGYRLGQNLLVERRGAQGRNSELPRLAQELVAAKVDVIITIGFPPVVAAKSTGIPTVAAAGVGDPVATGLVESLARPGGTVTGISDNATELSTKRLGLLKEIAPGLRRVAMLWNQDDLGMTLRYKASAEAAERLGISVQALGVREPNDFETAFAAMNRDMPDAILMVADALTNLNRKRVFDFAATHRLPAIYETEFYARDGGLMSYGGNLGEIYERAAALTDRILQGAKPAELPFEQPTRYDLVINLKAAKAIGLDVPFNLLARADEVIE
jgi:putative tryptophan/tyrosine transport system substrate-binding protein